MKRRKILFLAIPLLMLTSIRSFAQIDLPGMIEDEPSANDTNNSAPQRIGVPPVEVDLSAGSATISGFCFDEYLIAPRRVTNFKNILSGSKGAIVRTADGHSMPLAEAVRNGAIGIQAYQLNVTLTNRTGAPMTVALTQPTVLWDRPAGEVNPQALAVLASDGDYDDQQTAIWRVTTAERRLKILGYYNGSVWNINRDRFNNDVATFQRANGMQETGQLDGATMNRLAVIGNNLQSRLRRLGFADREGNSLKEDLAAQIRAYQRYLGQKPTGQWSEPMTARLASDEQIIPQVRSFKFQDGALGEALSQTSSSPNVLTALHGLRGVQLAMETPEGIEVWNRYGSRTQFLGRDETAVKKMDDAAVGLAIKATKADRVVIYPRINDGDKTTLIVGNRTVTMNASDLASYIKGGEVPASLAGAIEPLLPVNGGDMTGRGGSTSLVVYRGPFVQSRPLSDGSTLLSKAGLSQIDGAELASALDKTYGSRASIYLSDDLRAGARSMHNTDVNHGDLFSTPSDIRFAEALPRR